MFLKLQPLIFSIIFAFALETVAYKEELFFKVFFFLFFFSVLAVWPLARKLRFLAIPFFHSIGSLSLLYLIDSQSERHVFIVLASLIYYLALLGAYRLKLYDCDQTAQGMVNIATVSTIFFWYVANYGWYLNYAIDPWILIVTFAASTFLVSLPSFRICAAMQLKLKKRAEKRINGEPASQKSLEANNKGAFEEEKIPTYLLINNWVILFLNFILSLVMAQVIWGLSLWPFGHLTTGVTALIIYFVFWDVIRTFIQGTLSKRSVIINISLALLSIIGILATTSWQMLG